MNTHQAAIHETDVQAFRRTFHGSLLQPGDEEYDSARRIWNGMIDRRPAMIARCTSNDDVTASLRFAREHGLPVSVRGGGHNVAGSALREGGVVIDLSLMNDIRVDARNRRVHAQGGVTIGALDRSTQAYGLATPMGVVTETGIAGLTLGGGMGWMRRKHGLSCDALRSIDIITADGQLHYASKTENPDLFWAACGGGGNFGIVTRFEYELYDVGPNVFFLVVFYPISAARDVLRHIRENMAEAPDEFSPISFLTHVPSAESFPEKYHGEPCLVVVGPYIGEIGEGIKNLTPLRSLATPIADFSATIPYLEVQMFFDEEYPSGGRYYWKSINLNALTDEVIDRLIAINDASPSPHSTIDIWFQGGAMSRVGAEMTAFGERNAPVMIGIEANWHDEREDDACITWARGCYKALEPFSDGTMYFNFPGFEGEITGQVRATYGNNYQRLAAIKKSYDPDNIFRTHQNITPAEPT